MKSEHDSSLGGKKGGNPSPVAVHGRRVVPRICSLLLPGVACVSRLARGGWPQRHAAVGVAGTSAMPSPRASAGRGPKAAGEGGVGVTAWA